jgi:hypothetical protein
MSIDFDSYMYWDRELPGCWSDKGFREEFAKANPHTRVQSTSTTTVVTPGLSHAN